MQTLMLLFHLNCCYLCANAVIGCQPWIIWGKIGCNLVSFPECRKSEIGVWRIVRCVLLEVKPYIGMDVIWKGFYGAKVCNSLYSKFRAEVESKDLFDDNILAVIKGVKLKCTKWGWAFCWNAKQLNIYFPEIFLDLHWQWIKISFSFQ